MILFVMDLKPWCLSRRSFIEHCTTVHNMKFRTKSGATISAPTVLQKSQQAAAAAAAKRKAETEDAAAGAAATPENFKRPKTELATPQRSVVAPSDDGTPRGVNTQTGRRTLYTPAGVSKWNQCVYQVCCHLSKSYILV